MCGAVQKGRPTGRRRGPDLDGVRLALRRFARQPLGGLRDVALVGHQRAAHRALVKAGRRPLHEPDLALELDLHRDLQLLAGAVVARRLGALEPRVDLVSARDARLQLSVLSMELFALVEVVGGRRRLGRGRLRCRG